MTATSIHIWTSEVKDMGVHLTKREREALAWRTTGDASGDLSEGLVFEVEKIIAARLRGLDDDSTKNLIDALDMKQRDRRSALAMFKPLRNIALEAHLDQVDCVLDEFRQTDRDSNDEEEI